MNSYEETKNLLKDSSFYYVICINMDGRYSYVNNHYQHRFANLHGEIIGQPYHTTVHEEDWGAYEEVYYKCFEHPDKTFPATIRKHNDKSGYIITQWEYRALYDENNKPSGIFSIGFDITEFINDRYKLRDARTIIEKKDKVLKGIAFNQSHVIRRPLANIMGLASILEKMEINQDLRNLCNMLIESSHQLDEVIKDNVDMIYEEGYP